MSDVLEFKQPLPPERTDYGTEFIGPMVPEWKVVSGGYKVPFITARLNPEQEHEVLLVLDGRFGITGTREEVQKWVPFLADAMAVAAGYSCFGEQSVKHSRFSTRMAGIAEIVTEPQKETP